LVDLKAMFVCWGTLKDIRIGPALRWAGSFRSISNENGVGLMALKVWLYSSQLWSWFRVKGLAELVDLRILTKIGWLQPQLGLSAYISLSVMKTLATTTLGRLPTPLLLLKYTSTSYNGFKQTNKTFLRLSTLASYITNST